MTMISVLTDIAPSEVATKTISQSKYKVPAVIKSKEDRDKVT